MCSSKDWVSLKNNYNQKVRMKIASNLLWNSKDSWLKNKRRAAPALCGSILLGTAFLMSPEPLWAQDLPDAGLEEECPPEEADNEYPEDWCTPYDGICDEPCDEIDTDCLEEDPAEVIPPGEEDEADVLPPDEEDEADVLPPDEEDSADVLWPEEDMALEDEDEDAWGEETESGEDELPSGEYDDDEYDDDEYDDDEYDDDEYDDDEYDEPVFEEENPEDTAPLDEDCLIPHPEDEYFDDEDSRRCEEDHHGGYIVEHDGEGEADATIDINVNGCSSTSPAGLAPGLALFGLLLGFTRRRKRKVV
jgi:MYXO-CTERM domain-containing protein